MIKTHNELAVVVILFQICAVCYLLNQFVFGTLLDSYPLITFACNVCFLGFKRKCVCVCVLFFLSDNF